MWLSLVTVLAVNNVTAAPNSLIHYTKQKRDIKGNLALAPFDSTLLG